MLKHWSIGSELISTDAHHTPPPLSTGGVATMLYNNPSSLCHFKLDVSVLSCRYFNIATVL